jgi:hypothetical protein
MGAIFTKLGEQFIAWLTGWLNSVLIDVLTQLFGGSA